MPAHHIARKAVAHDGIRFGGIVEPTVQPGRVDQPFYIHVVPGSDVPHAQVFWLAYPDHHVQPFAQDVVQPVCSPAYLAANPALHSLGLEAVPESDLLHTSWGPSFGSNPTWRSWFKKAGLSANRDGGGFQVGRSSLVLDLAREGLGVALAQRMMAARDLADGRLIALSDVSLPLGHPYCLAYPPGKADKRDVVALVGWLTRTAN